MSGPSGKHANPRRNLTQPAERFAVQDEVAEAHGMTWAQWAQATLDRAARRYLSGRGRLVVTVGRRK